jgi:hypothetical protein
MTTPLTHEQAISLLHIGHGSLREDDQASLNVHLAKCDSCRAYAADLVMLEPTLITALSPDRLKARLSPGFTQHVLQDAKRNKMQRLILNYGAMALALIVPGIVAVVMRSSLGDPRPVDGTTAEAGQPITPTATQPTPQPIMTEVPVTGSPVPGATQAQATQVPGNGSDSATAPADTSGNTSPTLTPAEAALLFSASPTEIDPGGDVTLTWHFNGETAKLCEINPAGIFGQCHDVGPNGSMTLSAPDHYRNSYQYTLDVADHPEQFQQVTITIRCPDVWFFNEPTTVCPDGPAVISNGAAQRFEGGTMVWMEATKQIFVLYEVFNNTFAAPHGYMGYQIYDDPWQAGMPEDDPAISAPDGRYEPVRGFGMIWRLEDSGLPEWSVRDLLGWALEPEFTYETAYQCDTTATSFQAQTRSYCYLRLPDDRLARMYIMGGWTPGGPPR